MTTKKTNTNQIIIYVLFTALAGLAFFSGTLFTKVQNFEKNNLTINTGTKTSTTAQVPTPTAQPKEVPTLAQIATELDLNLEQFNNCVQTNKYQEKVNSQYDYGLSIGIRGTPGNILLDIKTGKSTRLTGAIPFSMAKSSIDKLLSNDPSLETETIAGLKVEQDDHIFGNQDAQIILFEYSDFECPFCTRFHPTAFQIIDEYNGQVAWVYRHFPLRELHPSAQMLAEASECAFEQGGNDAFWNFTNNIYSQ